MYTTKKAQASERQPYFPSLEKIQQELGTAKSIDDFFGKEGIFARLFAQTLETMLEAELTEHLGYERYAAKGRNSGNSCNGKRPKKLRTSAGDSEVQLPRDRNSEFSSQLLEKHRTSTNELEEKILAMYGKGMSTRDIQNLLEETYGVEVSADTIHFAVNSGYANCSESIGGSGGGQPTCNCHKWSIRCGQDNPRPVSCCSAPESYNSILRRLYGNCQVAS
jgi:hypothetical protein